jgi:hypothetical protein
MVTDIVALDRLVSEQVLKPFDGQDLRKVFGKPAVDGAAVAEAIWNRIVRGISRGKLERIKLVQTRDLQFEYAG